MRVFVLSVVILLAVVPAVRLAAQPTNANSPGLVPSVDDVNLSALVAETLRTHPAVGAARAAFDASDALEQAAARPLFNPSLDVDVDSSQSNQRTIGISQTFEARGQRAAREAVAALEREIAGAEVVNTRRDVAMELLSALADYHSAADQDVLAQRRLETMHRFADVALLRQRAGDLTQVDLAAAQLALAQARIERARSAGAIAEAEQSLRALAPTSSVQAWPPLPTTLPPVAMDAAALEPILASLPELRIELARVAAARARVDLRENERRPTPTFGLLAGQEEGDSLVGLSFSIPINVRNRFTAEVAAARAEQRQLEASATNVEARARGHMLATTERYRLTRDAWISWVEDGEPNLAEQAVLLERLWDAGDLSLTDYLVQLDQAFATATSALDLQHELWRAWLDWLGANGQLGTWLAVEVE